MHSQRQWERRKSKNMEVTDRTLNIGTKTAKGKEYVDMME